MHLGDCWRAEVDGLTLVITVVPDGLMINITRSGQLQQEVRSLYFALDYAKNQAVEEAIRVLNANAGASKPYKTINPETVKWDPVI